MQAGREGKGRVANLLAECEQHASTSTQRPQQTLGTLLSQALQETSVRSLAGQQADQVGPQVAQWERTRPTAQETEETQLRSLGREAPLEKEMATHSSIPAWEIPWTEEPGRLQSTGLQGVRYH